MLNIDNIKKFLTENIKNTDIFVVDVTIKPSNKVGVFIDSTKAVTIDDCAKINRMFTAHFDREKEDYALEVSSAGLTSPFKVKEQYLKNIGKQVKIKTKDGNVISGELKSFENNVATLLETKKNKGKTISNQHIIALDNILETKLIIKFF